MTQTIQSILLEMKCLHQELVVPWKQKRYEGMVAALERLSPGFRDLKSLNIPFDIAFSLLQQTVFAVRRASDHGDIELVKSVLSNWEMTPDQIMQNRYVQNGVEFLVIDSKNCLNHSRCNSYFDNSAYLVVDSALENPRMLSAEYLHQTCLLVEKAGSPDILRMALSVIINLNKFNPEFDMVSYQLATFLGVVYSDYTNHPLHYAESILHESVHSLFNSFLQAMEINLSNHTPNGRELYSPWKDQKRPAFGLVHAIITFSVIYDFYRVLREGDGFGLLTTAQVEYCENRARFELDRLAQVRDSIYPALTEFGDERITELVVSLYPSNI